MYYFFKNLKIKYRVMMTKEGSTEIMTFLTPGAGVLMLEYGHISHNSENSINKHHIDCYCVK